MFRVNKTFIVFLCLAFTFAYIEGGNLPYSIFYCLFFIFISGVIDAFVHINDIRVRVNFDRPIYSTGESTGFNIIVKNSSIIPASYVLVKNSAYSQFNSSYSGHGISLRPDETKWINISVQFNKRGIYNFGLVSCSVKDLFSLFQLSKNVNKENIVKVYPKIHKLDYMTTKGNEYFDTLMNKKGNIEDLSTVDDIRKYRMGDSLSRIHWKISAKHGELYTKNFDTAVGQECNLMLDMNKAGYFMENGELAEEQLVELFVSVVDYMRKRGIKSRIFINNTLNKKFEVVSVEDMDVIKEYFLMNKSTGESSFVRFIDASSYDIEKTGWFGIFVSKISGRIKEEIMSLRYAGYNLTVFYVYGDAESLEHVKTLKGRGVECLSFNEVVCKK